MNKIMNHSEAPSDGNPHMSTTQTSIQITCPSWCTVDPQTHTDGLWSNGGVCLHHGPDVVVEDPTDHHVEPWDEPRFHEPVTVTVSAVTRPDGREAAPPTFYIDGREHSLEQSQALAVAIQQTVALYQGATPRRRRLAGDAHSMPGDA